MRIGLYADASVVGIDDTAQFVAQLASDAGVEDVQVVPFGSVVELLDVLAPAETEPLDLVISPYQLPGISSIEAISEAREIAPLLQALLFDSSSLSAADAAAADVSGFLVTPIEADAFARALLRQLSQLQDLRANSFVMATRKGMRRVAFCDVLYCETYGHDQVVHLADGSTVVGRYPSQGMFGLLAGDARFYKVGSSYIVNMDEVDQAHITNGVLTLSDGTNVNIPSRLRKSFEGALIGATPN